MVRDLSSVYLAAVGAAPVGAENVIRMLWVRPCQPSGTMLKPSPRASASRSVLMWRRSKGVA